MTSRTMGESFPGGVELLDGQELVRLNLGPDPPRSSVIMLLHPVVLLAGVWLAAIAIWAAVPQAVLNLTPRGTRTISTHALVYIGACLFSFAGACLAVSLVRPRRPLAHSRATSRDRTAAPRLVTAKRILAGAVVLGTLVWIARALIMIGGPAGLAAYIGGGESIASLKSDVTIPAQLPPITTLVHLTPGAIALLVYLYVRGEWTFEDWVWFGTLAAITALRAVMMAERLALVGTVSAGVITYLTAAPTIRWGRLAAVGLGLLVAAYLVWTFGEFSRSWRDSRPPGSDASLSVGNYMSSISYSNIRLGAYVFTAIDNAVITIDSWPTQSFPSATSPPLAAAGLARFEVGAPDPFQTKLNPEFTGLTMPGLFFQDAREFGVVLALVYGAFFGLAWRLAFAGSVAGIVLYGSTAQIVIDSFRMTYLFDTQGIAAILAATIVWLVPILLTPDLSRSPLTRSRRPRESTTLNGTTEP